MAEKKVTAMVIKVDLGCEKCYKKIKKVLCKIPEIQNQTYDRKANTVTITVVCCYPEKIKKKICCKGGEAVKAIEIKAPEMKKDTKDGKDKKDKKDGKPPTDNVPKPVPGYPVLVCPKACCSECYQWCGGGPCLHGCGRPTPPCKEPCGRPTPLCYEPCGRPCFDSCSRCSCSCRSKGYYSCRCEYGYDNNPSSCTII